MAAVARHCARGWQYHRGTDTAGAPLCSFRPSSYFRVSWPNRHSTSAPLCLQGFFLSLYKGGNLLCLHTRLDRQVLESMLPGAVVALDLWELV